MVKNEKRRKIASDDKITIYESKAYYFISDGSNESAIPKEETLLGGGIALLIKKIR